MPYTDLANAIGALLQAMVNIFGVAGTVGLAIGLYGVLALRRIYLDRVRGRDTDRAIKAMEASVQRCAQEAREWRLLFMKEKAGWSLEEAERIVMAGEYGDPTESRKALQDKFGSSKKKGEGS